MEINANYFSKLAANNPQGNTPVSSQKSEFPTSCFMVDNPEAPAPTTAPAPADKSSNQQKMSAEKLQKIASDAVLAMHEAWDSGKVDKAGGYFNTVDIQGPDVKVTDTGVTVTTYLYDKYCKRDPNYTPQKEETSVYIENGRVVKSLTKITNTPLGLMDGTIDCTYNADGTVQTLTRKVQHRIIGAEVTTESQTNEYTYNDKKQLTRKEVEINSLGHKTNKVYNYKYNEQGQIISVRGSDNEDCIYDENGLLIERILYSGYSEDGVPTVGRIIYEYNSKGERTGSKTYINGSPQGSVNWSERYSGKQNVEGLSRTKSTKSKQSETIEQPNIINDKGGVRSDKCLGYMYNKIYNMGLEIDIDLLLEILNKYDYDFSGNDSIISPDELYDASKSKYMNHDANGKITDTYALDFLSNIYAERLKK